MIQLPRFELKESAPLLSDLGQPIRSEHPQPMEALGQNYGFILYRKKIDHAGPATLEVTDARDYALVYQAGKRLGVLDRRINQVSLDVDLHAGVPLDILVENMGRVNFGPNMVTDRKGIIGKVLLGEQELTGWEIYPLPLADLSHLTFTAKPQQGPSFHRGVFNVDLVGDTYLDMRGWGKGLVWINGHNLGRYWRIGPQQSLFVPSGWLQEGQNVIIVLDLEEAGNKSIQGTSELIFETHTAE